MTEDLKILAEDIQDFCNAVEAAAVKLRMQIDKLLGTETKTARVPFNASKIQWETREGTKGQYQLSEDYNNPEHKNLLKFLSEHRGCVYSEGFLYWVFQNGSSVGRKKKTKT